MKKKWFLYAVIAVSIFLPGTGLAQQAANKLKIPPAILQKLQEKGVVRVDVELNIPGGRKDT